MLLFAWQEHYTKTMLRGECCQCGNVANTNVANGQLETGIGNNGNILTGALREISIPGPWTVEFESDELHRGPKEPVKFDKLIDLSTSDDPAIKYYSGKLVYRTTFTLPSSSLPSTLSLDLGEVSVTAKVKVNGKDAGGVCFAPYRLDIAPFVKAGENELEIEVCNLWVNRLVGDDGLENRPTWTSIPCADKKRTKLLKSGLLGPVSIQYRTAEKVDAAKTAAALGGAATVEAFRSALSEKTPLADVTLSNGDFAGGETATAEIGRTPDSGDKFLKAEIGEK